MSIRKQSALTAFVLFCAAFIIFSFYPVSPAVLSRLDLLSSLFQTGSYGVKPTSATSQERPRGNSQGGAGSLRSALVFTRPATSGTLSNRLKAIGSGDALKSVSVVPQISGVVTDVTVVSGSKVKAGDVLALIESREQEIAVGQAKVALLAAKDKLDRYTKLRKSNIASQVELAELQTVFDAAELTLQQANYNLQLRTILAPVDGSVGIILVEPGDYVTTATEIAMIDDRSKIVVDFWIPERFAGLVKIGQSVEATSFAYSNVKFRGEISAVGGRVEVDSRTMQLQATIDNGDDRLRPGMSFSMSTSFSGEEFPAVDPLAVQWDSTGSYVWTIKDAKAQRIPVRIVQRKPERILVDAELPAGSRVITEGVLALRNGSPVRTPTFTASEKPSPLAETDGSSGGAQARETTEQNSLQQTVTPKS